MSILYLTESGTPSFDGSTPDYSFFTTKLQTDNSYGVSIKNSGEAHCMVMYPSSVITSYEVDISSITIAGNDISHSIQPGDYVIKIYNKPGTSTPTNIASLYNDTAFVSRFISETPSYNGDLFTINFIPDIGCNNFTFNPTSSRDIYYILCILPTQTLSPSITIFKTRSINSEYRNTTETISVVPLLDSNFYTNSIAVFSTPETNFVDYLASDNTNGQMGLIALTFNGTLSGGPPVCFHGLSLIKTDNGIVYAKDITTDYKLINGDKKYTISKIIKTKNCKEFIHIKCNSLSENKPYSDLYITRTHMIKIGDTEYQAQELLDKYEGVSLVQLDKSCDVYSFVTENGYYVDINGLDVKTFNSNEFINY